MSELVTTNNQNGNQGVSTSCIMQQVRNTFFANIASRKVSFFATFQKCIAGGMKIAKEHFQALMQEVTKYGGICYTAGSAFAPVILGVIVKHKDSLILLRNPADNSEESIIAKMDENSLCFENMNVNPILFWQNDIEPVHEQSFAYC